MLFFSSDGIVSGDGFTFPGGVSCPATVSISTGPSISARGDVLFDLFELDFLIGNLDWSSPIARRNGMIEFMVAQIDSAKKISDDEFASLYAAQAIRSDLPVAIREAAKFHPMKKHKTKLLAAAAECTKTGSIASSVVAADVCVDAAKAAIDADPDAAKICYDAHDFANDITNVRSRVDFAEKRSEKTPDAIRDLPFLQLTRDITQILISLDAPGTKWFDLIDCNWRVRK